MSCTRFCEWNRVRHFSVFLYSPTWKTKLVPSIALCDKKKKKSTECKLHRTIRTNDGPSFVRRYPSTISQRKAYRKRSWGIIATRSIKRVSSLKKKKKEKKNELNRRLLSAKSCLESLWKALSCAISRHNWIAWLWPERKCTFHCSWADRRLRETRSDR